MASIFTKIIAGELPAYRIFENDLVISFLTIDPIRGGHTLVVPKTEVDAFMDVSNPEYQEVFRVAQIIGKAIKTATGCERVGMAVQGFEVRHFHLHLIPMWSPADFDFKKATRMAPAQLEEMQAKIKAKLKL
ncbi:MAG: HIT family protein [Bdellovibrionota bacterium]